MANAERERLEGPDARAWKRWGPYVSERAWGTVREDYGGDDDATWSYLPHDHARSRTYRWSEDGLGGVCDDHQYLCLAFAFWNGRDPILKERVFGLDGKEGIHGEDAKEYWFYLDSTPTHSWMRWRYLYPQAAFPYGDLLAGNARSTKADPEFELLDTGVFHDDRYWEVTVDYAKAGPDDLCLRLTVRNAGPDEATISVLPTLWFRNVWSWDIDDPRSARPELHRSTGGGSIVADHAVLGTMTLATDGAPDVLVCENESNARRLWGTGAPAGTPWPKDGINDHVVAGTATVNPAGTGTKAALHHRMTVAPGGSTEIRLRLSAATAPDLGDAWAAVMAGRQAQADEFYAALAPAAPPAEAAVMRQALAGMLWSKQLYHYDVARWLDGDPAGPPPPEAHRHGRNAGWRHLNNFDVISMPDKWEYPWFAAWDLAFHCVALAHVDPRFAKDQLLLLCREWYMHPNGQLPAYEWSFGDVNPPVHAWAALRVFEIDGSRDHEFLERVMHKLLLNFTWWVNRKDTEDNNVFEGRLLSILNPDRLARVLQTMLDEDEFLSPHGLRALSRHHLANPYRLPMGDGREAVCGYEPAESAGYLFGGNSNWRGPVWFPVNYLAIEALRRFHRYFGDDLTVELPTGSGRRATLGEVADDLSQRLVSLFLDDGAGRRPVFGTAAKFQDDPAWHGLLPFHEYFHGDTGAGLGASHQTGWTGLVADLVIGHGVRATQAGNTVQR